jgi:hypothetical protein
MEHSFAEVPRADIPRSSFNRSHGYKTTFDADYLIPVLVDDIVPGDTFNVNMHFFARLATPLHPIMDNMWLESFFFFVPYRLVWDNWEKMHGAQDDPADSIDFSIPVCTDAHTVGEGELWDYMGLPLGLNANVTTDISALPFRAYRLVWNEWFRDENLQDSVSVQTDDGPDTNAESGYGDSPLKRGKRHDYFTSCLPWTQKGTAVSIPLGGQATVVSTGGFPTWTNASSETVSSLVTGNPVDGNVKHNAGWTATASAIKMQDPQLVASLGSATNVTINELRLAFQTQRLLERDARSGTRYNEMILAHFGS